MTQEDKQLLLKDLCARLPYGVKVHLETLEYGELIGTLDAVYPNDDRVIIDNLSKAIAPINVRTGGFLIGEDNVKPFLRTLSSMTEKEGFELDETRCYTQLTLESYDWLNSHHFDYRGLIEKGLAIEMTEENNTYKE